MQTITANHTVLPMPIHGPSNHDVQYNECSNTWIEFHAHNFSKYCTDSNSLWSIIMYF